MFDENYQGSFGAQRTAWVALALTNWIGDDGFLWKLASRHRVMGGKAWVFTCAPRVKRTYIQDGHCCVEVACALVNQAGTEVTSATAAVILPSRRRGPVVYPFPRPAL